MHTETFALNFDWKARCCSRFALYARLVWSLLTKSTASIIKLLLRMSNCKKRRLLLQHMPSAGEERQWLQRHQRSTHIRTNQLQQSCQLSSIEAVAVLYCTVQRTFYPSWDVKRVRVSNACPPISSLLSVRLNSEWFIVKWAITCTSCPCHAHCSEYGNQGYDASDTNQAGY